MDEANLVNWRFDNAVQGPPGPPGVSNDTLPHRLSYGKRVPLRTSRQVTNLLNGTAGVAALHTGVVGYAAYAGVTGGYGHAIYYVNDPSLDPTIQYSLGWALEQSKAAGGGQIYFDPVGRFDVVLSERIVFEVGHNNLTICAPGFNVTFWCDRLNGAALHENNNHIWKNIYFRPLPGPINGTAIGEDESRAKTLVQILYDLCDRIAFINCEFRHPSWHCLDVTRADPADGHLCRVSVQNTIFWDAIQGHLLGTNNANLDPADYTDDDSPRECFITFYECIWAYNLQRNPKVLGNCMVDIVNCLWLLQPYQTEYVDGDGKTYPEVQSDIFGAAVQEGGWLRARGCLAMSSAAASLATNLATPPVPIASLLAGKEATHLMPAENAYSGNTGRMDVVGCEAEDGIVYVTRNPELIPAVPYDLPNTAVPAPGPLRAAWAEGIWSRAGARVDAAPEGTFEWVPGSTAFPNGETVVMDRNDLTGQFERVDGLLEYAIPSADKSDDLVLTTPRGVTRIVGRSSGKSTGAAIEPSILDLTGLTSGYFSVNGDGGPSNIRDIISQVEANLADGMTLQLFGSSSVPVTLKSAVTIAASAVNAATDTLTVTGHGRTGSGFQVTLVSAGTVPAPLVAAARYYGVYVDANNIKLAPTHADALAGTNIIDLTDVGSGAISVTIGNLNLPGSRDIILDSSAKVVTLKLNSANNRFNVSVGTVTSVAGRAGDIVLTKADVGLGNVDNTSDANKPVSTAQATAIAAKEPTIAAGTAAQYWRGDKSWQTLDKSAVSLSNVDNTADTNKPVSTAQQTALDLKLDKAGGTVGTLTVGDGTAFKSFMVLVDAASNAILTLRRVDNTSQAQIYWNGGNLILAPSSGGGMDIRGDQILLRSSASVTRITINSTNVTSTLPVVVPDAAYGVGWNGSAEVPTKNAVYDKIESLGGGGSSAYPAYTAGRFYLGTPANLSTGVALGAGTIRLMPIMINQSITISDLGVRISTAGAAGATIRLGIYGIGSDGLPSGTPLGQTGSLVATATGAVSGALSGGNIILAPGLYYTAIQSSDAAVICLTPSATSLWPGTVMGDASLSTLLNSSSSAATSRTYAGSYATGFVDFTSTATTSGNTAAMAAVAFKAA